MYNFKKLSKINKQQKFSSNMKTKTSDCKCESATRKCTCEPCNCLSNDNSFFF